MILGIPEPKITGVGIVRDRYGMPRVDGDPDALAAEIKAALTVEEMTYLRSKYHGDTGHSGG